MQDIVLQDDNLAFRTREAYKTLRSNIEFSGRDVRIIAVTSCTPNEGKSEISFELARSFAQNNRQVLLIDADLRLSIMNAHYDIQLSGPGNGLAHLLSGQCEPEDAIYETNLPNLYFLPIGRDVSNPLSLIATPDFDQLIKSAGEAFDYVFLDTPPIGLVIDSAEMARSCDGSVLVLEYNKTHRRAMAEAKKQLERTGTPILGCVLNKVTMDRLSTKKYYSYGGKYGYGYGYDRQYGYGRSSGKQEDGKKG